MEEMNAHLNRTAKSSKKKVKSKWSSSVIFARYIGWDLTPEEDYLTNDFTDRTETVVRVFRRPLEPLEFWPFKHFDSLYHYGIEVVFGHSFKVAINLYPDIFKTGQGLRKKLKNLRKGPYEVFITVSRTKEQLEQHKDIVRTSIEDTQSFSGNLSPSNLIAVIKRVAAHSEPRFYNYRKDNCQLLTKDMINEIEKEMEITNKRSPLKTLKGGSPNSKMYRLNVLKSS